MRVVDSWARPVVSPELDHAVRRPRSAGLTPWPRGCCVATEDSVSLDGTCRPQAVGFFSLSSHQDLVLLHRPESRKL